MSSQTDLISKLEARLRIPEDKDALHSLKNTYCSACDRHDFNAFAATYTPDGVMEFTEWSAITGHRRSESSRGGIGTAYISFYATPEVKDPETHYALGGRYHLELRRTEEGWRVARQKMEKLWARGSDTTGIFTKGE